MKERILQVMADVDANKLLDLIEDDIEEMVILYTDAEITRQFMTIQAEIEGVCKQYLKELFDKYYLESELDDDGKSTHIEGVCKQYLKELFDKYYLESGERR